MDNQSQQFLSELSHCIDENDAVKGCALMPFFAEMPESVRHMALKRLFLSMESPGYPIVKFLCRHLKTQKDASALAWIVRCLITPTSFGPEDENRLSFWSDAMAEMGLFQAIPELLNLITETHSSQVMASALRAILKIDSEDGARLIMRICEEEPARGARIAETLPLAGKIGFLGVAELLTSRHHGLRNLAIDIFGAAGDHGVLALATHLEEADIDSAIHAINALGRSGSNQAIAPLLKRLRREHDHDNIRYAIFEAAGRLPSAQWALHLARGLADPSEQVRMAAARAVDRNLSSALITGIANIIAFEDTTAEAVVGALIDARVENTLAMLLKAKGFPKLAEAHLIHQAHPEIRQSCLAFLEKRGAKALSARVRKATEHQTATSNRRIVCVDDSRMILMLYMKHLNAMGYEAVVFDKPEEALTALDSISPELVITDLNMPGMDGFTFATRTRQAWPGLPILMVTTQSDAAPPAGDGISPIDRLLQKPFTQESLEEAMEALIGMDQAIDF